MPRIARVVIPGCPHHVIQRGNRRLKVCLMDNHVHMIAIPNSQDSLARGIGEAHRKYTNLINIRENWKGYLWQGRFISYPMDGGHLFAAVRYIERNPVRAQIVSRAEQYRWSSAAAHVLKAKDDILSACPLTADIKDWASYLSQKDEDAEIRKIAEHEHTGRPLGDKAFIKKLEELTGRILAPQKRGRKEIGDTIPIPE
jgi:putative transposase